MNEIEFVSYNGEYPCLCMGTLVLKINGKEYSDFSLCSGGGCGFRNDYSDEWISHGPWEVTVPEELKYLKDKINKVVNENVPFGCCGGCL